MSAPASAPARPRSCVVCRTRKVKCDKTSPCSNCRRANIACVFPSADRPPRWARRLEHVANAAAASALASASAPPSAPTSIQAPASASAPSVPPAQAGGVAETQQVLDRLQTLESLVHELSRQLQQTQQSADRPGPLADSVVQTTEGASPQAPPRPQDSASPSSSAGSMHRDFGRLVLQNPHRSRYISSGFWSRVNDELDAIKAQTASMAGEESDSSDDESPPSAQGATLEQGRPATERNAFLFRHNLGSAGLDSGEFHPLPSQIPFLLTTYQDNVGLFTQVVHMPTVSKLVSGARAGGTASLTPPSEALLFAIYYAAITSMEDDDVMTNFGRPKTELNLKFRLGFEHALAKADFLNEPDLVLVQALVVFLCLARRHDSPRYVWMMTGLAIRMAQAVGLQRDGAHFGHLGPFDIEMRRRVWWSLCMLDTRASEDQGTDLTIARSSFDTKMPLSINDADIEPGASEAPVAREGMTDMTFALVWINTNEVTRQIVSLGPKEDGTPDLEQQSRLLEELYASFDKNYFRHCTDFGDIKYWVGLTIARLVMAKMSLLIHLPVLFSSPSESFSAGIRSKLLVNAIEVAEYNHALNAEEACRHWRWVYQTYTHWPAIVYILIEISRRPWGFVVERAWAALHSTWLIPASHSARSGNVQFWVPLRKLMVRARKHRAAELARLGGDPEAARTLEIEDGMLPQPGSSGPYPAGVDVVGLCRERWRQLVSERGPRVSGVEAHGTEQPPLKSSESPHASRGDGLGATAPDARATPPAADPRTGRLAISGPGAAGWTEQGSLTAECLQPYDALAASGPLPWLWGDNDMFADMDMSVGNDDVGGVDWMDWQDWVESANNMSSGAMDK